MIREILDFFLFAVKLYKNFTTYATQYNHGRKETKVKKKKRLTRKKFKKKIK